MAKTLWSFGHSECSRVKRNLGKLCIIYHESSQLAMYPITLRKAKLHTILGLSEYNRVNYNLVPEISMLFKIPVDFNTFMCCNKSYIISISVQESMKIEPLERKLIRAYR